MKRFHAKSSDEIKARLLLEYGDLITLGDDYVCISKRCTFIDRDFGLFTSLPYNVLKYKGSHHLRRRKNQSLGRCLKREIFEKRISVVHNNEVTVGDDYKNTVTKCTFIDCDFGVWRANAGNVMRGQGHPLKGMKKYMKSLHRYPSLKHWQTQEECFSSSSYEFAVLIWLNYNRYDYDWQTTFPLPLLTHTGKQAHYTVDLYIKSGPFANTYVEIKGTWFDRNRAENRGRLYFEKFASLHPNTVVWMKSELKTLDILRKDKPRLDLYEKILLAT